MGRAARRSRAAYAAMAAMTRWQRVCVGYRVVRNIRDKGQVGNWLSLLHWVVFGRL